MRLIDADFSPACAVAELKFGIRVAKRPGYGRRARRAGRADLDLAERVVECHERLGGSDTDKNSLAVVILKNADRWRLDLDASAASGE